MFIQLSTPSVPIIPMLNRKKLCLDEKTAGMITNAKGPQGPENIGLTQNVLDSIIV